MPTLRWFGGWCVMSLPSIVIVPGGRLLEAGDHPERRRLAAAGRAEERHELALLGREVEVLDGDVVRRNCFWTPVELEEGHRCASSDASSGPAIWTRGRASRGRSGRSGPSRPRSGRS